MEPFLQQLTDLIQTEPTLAKWIVVPSLAVGHNIAERLVSEGIAWGNLRFTTVFDLAARVAGPELARAGKTLLDPAVGPALTLELLLDRRTIVGEYTGKEEFSFSGCISVGGSEAAGHEYQHAS